MAGKGGRQNKARAAFRDSGRNALCLLGVMTGRAGRVPSEKIPCIMPPPKEEKWKTSALNRSRGKGFIEGNDVFVFPSRWRGQRKVLADP